MANYIYPSAKQSFLGQSPTLDLDSETIKVALVSAGYTNSTSHQYYSSVSSSVVGTPATLANKSITNGVFDADDVTFTSVTSTSQVTQIVIYRDASGVASNSPLIAYFDSPTSGLPITPNGGNITIAWSNDSSKIFKL